MDKPFKVNKSSLSTCRQSVHKLLAYLLGYPQSFLLAKRAFDVLDVMLKLLIVFQHFGNFVMRMNNGRMVAPAEFLANFRQREIGHLT